MSLRAYFLSIVLLALSDLAGADVISTLGPGGSFNQASGNPITGNATGFKALAIKLNPVATPLRVDNVAIGGYQIADRALAFVKLMRNINLRPDPNNIVESYSLSFTQTPQLRSASSLIHPVLEVGQTYWLVLEPGSSDSELIWNDNSQLITGTISYSNELNVWQEGLGGQTGPAFQISGSSVPEPNSAVLLIISCTVVAASRIRLKKSPRPSLDV